MYVCMYVCMYVDGVIVYLICPRCYKEKPSHPKGITCTTAVSKAEQFIPNSIHIRRSKNIEQQQHLPR